MTPEREGQRQRLLLSAYVCAKEAGSEPEIGYTTLLAAVRAGYSVTVLTWAPQAPQLQVDLRSDGASGVEVVGVTGPASLERYLGRLGLGHVHYVAWQMRALRVARSLGGSVDVAHHVTFGADWMPSALHWLPDTIPVVWGPVGGCANPAWSVAPYLTARGMAQEVVREALTRTIRRWTLRVVRRSGALVVAHNEDTARWYRQQGCPTVTRPLIAMPPVPAGPPSLGDALANRSSSTERDGMSGARRRTMLFIGRLAPWKGCMLAVRTLACLDASWHLEIYGKGSAKARITVLAAHLGVAGRVHFMGHVPKSDVWTALEGADVLLQPSIHDSAPQPVAQAVRSGCPVVCLDAAGPPVLAGEHGTAVRLGKNLPARLAAAVSSAERFAPDDRWSAARLPGVLDEIYRRAMEPAKTAS